MQSKSAGWGHYTPESMQAADSEEQQLPSVLHQNPQSCSWEAPLTHSGSAGGVVRYLHRRLRSRLILGGQQLLRRGEGDEGRQPRAPRGLGCG